MFEELDKVVLTHDIKEYDLKDGDRGTVVHVYGKGKGYEVEFFNAKGETIAVLTLLPHDLLLYRNKDEHIFRWFNAPISLGTVSSMTFTEREERGLAKDINIINELAIKTESKDNLKKYRFTTI